MLDKFALKTNNCALNVENSIKTRKKQKNNRLKIMSMPNQSQKAGIFFNTSPTFRL